MASLERRGNRYRIIFRLGGRKHHVSVNAADQRDAEACLGRLEENLRLVERGRLAVPDGAEVGLFLLTDGRLDKKVRVERAVRLGEMFDTRAGTVSFDIIKQDRAERTVGHGNPHPRPPERF